MMIGIDTNVLVRFVMQDDPKQAKHANAFFASLSDQNKGFLSVTTMIESVWVLERVYQVTREQVFALLKQLLKSSDIQLEQLQIVNEATKLYMAGADFADAMIACASRAAGCSRTVTFDRDAIKRTQMVLVS